MFAKQPAHPVAGIPCVHDDVNTIRHSPFNNHLVRGLKAISVLQARSFVCVCVTDQLLHTYFRKHGNSMGLLLNEYGLWHPTSRPRRHQAGLPIEEMNAPSIAQEHLSGSPNAACRAPDCPTALKMAMFTTKTHDKSSVP